MRGTGRAEQILGAITAPAAGKRAQPEQVYRCYPRRAGLCPTRTFNVVNDVNRGIRSIENLNIARQRVARMQKRNGANRGYPLKRGRDNSRQ